MDSLTLTAPDDWHIHLRRRAGPQHDSARHCSLGKARHRHAKPHPTVISAADATAYRNRILAEVPAGIDSNHS